MGGPGGPATSTPQTEETQMAILVIANDPSGTPELSAMFKETLGHKALEAPGSLSHTGGPVASGGWQIVDARETREDLGRWFATEVVPLRPSGAPAAPPPQIFDLETVTVRR